MKRILLAALPAALCLCSACSSKKIDTEIVYTGVTHTFVRKAQIYQTSGDYLSNLPIQISGSTITSYPAPTDITANSTPIPLAYDYLLDRRGVTGESVFTTYTYADYMALPSAPAISALKAAVIPGACVTRIVTLPMTQAEAEADTAAVNRLITIGLPGCTVTYTRPRLTL
jgi:hypothetical protein